GVDIWIAPGVTISNSTGDTVTDDGSTVNCNIFGYGYLTQTSTDTYAVCNFTDPNSKISVKCDIIENESAGQACVNSAAKKFHLECNLVYGKSHGGIYLNSNNSDDININAEKVITGQIGEPNTGTTAIISRGKGFINIHEILCRNLGHCLTHRAGEITAIVRKSTSIMNTNAPISTVHLHQGEGYQKLIMYFDEIANFKGAGITSLVGIEVHQGTGIFIGRKVVSENKAAALIGPGTLPTSTPNYLDLKCNELISLNTEALTVNESTNKTFINVNYIQSNYIVVVFTDSNGLFEIKNAKIRNLSSSNDAIGIGLNNNQNDITLNNIKVIAGDSENGRPINTGNTSLIEIINFGLFVNSPLNSSIVELKVGNAINYYYIQDEDLT
ncbi:MAG: hypothetical protein JSS91_12800, partial [Bacteroidetes bacterium]|nr:hypothetical protein [Bacteroidota bacterium]